MKLLRSALWNQAILLGLLGAAGLSAAAGGEAPPGRIAPKPLFRDPVYDGAADPVVIWNRGEKKWFMFYTNRRANLPDNLLTQVTWVHGTRIGIAESADGGATWTYRGTADIGYGEKDYTQWAPEVIAHDGTYHMFLTIVPGIFDDWNHPRDIIHLTSTDLLNWKYESTLKLSSDRVIDPCVHRLADGTWRLWYNNERDNKSIYYADSPDLASWTDCGKVTGVGERPGEGPYVFQWKGFYWMLVDVWKGLGVYRSDDAQHWTVQADNLLDKPGRGPDDGANGGHPGVVVSGDRAYCFYFLHPGRMGTIQVGAREGSERRRSLIQVVELHYADGRITCNRDQPTYINLLPPMDPPHL
jgi:hypothetical protein